MSKDEQNIARTLHQSRNAGGLSGLRSLIAVKGQHTVSWLYTELACGEHEKDMSALRKGPNCA